MFCLLFILCVWLDQLGHTRRVIHCTTKGKRAVRQIILPSPNNSKVSLLFLDAVSSMRISRVSVHKETGGGGGGGGGGGSRRIAASGLCRCGQFSSTHLSLSLHCRSQPFAVSHTSLPPSLSRPIRLRSSILILSPVLSISEP